MQEALDKLGWQDKVPAMLDLLANAIDFGQAGSDQFGSGVTETWAACCTAVHRPNPTNKLLADTTLGWVWVQPLLL